MAVVDPNPPHVIRGTPYSDVMVTASGGTAPYSFVANSGLPTSMLLAADGTLSGTTCGGNGNYNVSVTVTDSTAATATGTVQVIVNAAAGACSLTIAPATLLAGTVGTAYSQTVTASGGTAPYAFVVSSGSLPTGLSLAANGAISGTPTSAGSITFSIRTTDSASNGGVRTYTMTIAAPPPLLLSSTPAAVRQVGVAYSQSNLASGGVSPYAYAITGGALPAGVTLNAGTGLASGTPTSAGAFSYTVSVTDAVAATATQTVSGTVAPTVTLASSPAAATQVGVAYSQANVASGGTSPYAYAISAGALPAGVTLNAVTGLVSGTPTSAGAFSYTVQVTDAVAATATQAVSVTIATAVALAASPSAATQVGVAYSQANVASGGTTPYAYSISAGALPAGVTLNGGTGLASGTPTLAGAFGYTITVTDAVGATASQPSSGTIAAVAVPLSLVANPPGATQVGVAYSQSNVASGGTAPYAYSISAGALPAGVTLNAGTGLVSGTPTAAGAFSYTVRVSDAVAASSVRIVSGTLAAAPSIAVATGAPSLAEVGIAYTQTNSGSGGSGAFTYTLASGALPAGLTLNASTGLVSGTPTVAGAFSYSVRATDNANPAASAVGAVVGGSVVPTVTIASSPPAQPAKVGAAYAQVNAASGGTAPHVYSIAAGNLPAGLTLDTATGLVSGVPSLAGAYGYTVRVIDGAGAVAVGTSISGTIGAAPVLSFTPATPGPLSVGVLFAQPLVVAGGTAPYSFAITSGTLPPGVTFDAVNGSFGGTPTLAGSYTFTVRATDAQGASATLAVTLLVKAAVIVVSGAPVAYLNQATMQSLQATGGLLI